MTNEELQKIYVKADMKLDALKDNIHHLAEENKQLKGILQKIYERAINTNITSLDFRNYILEILGDKE